MTRWRPRNTIRVLAIGLVWRETRLLVAEVRDDDGNLKGVRPLGGGVDFSERWREALIREFHEELGLQVRVVGPPEVLENLYVHEGMRGHEIVFAARVLLPEGALPGWAPIPCVEDNGAAFTARWVDPETLDRPGGPALYPTGLRDILRKPQ